MGLGRLHVIRRGSKPPERSSSTVSSILELPSGSMASAGLTH